MKKLCRALFIEGAMHPDDERFFGIGSAVILLVLFGGMAACLFLR